jgi:hypothetical protein
MTVGHDGAAGSLDTPSMTVASTLRRWFRAVVWSVGMWTFILVLNAAAGAVST